MTIVAEQAPFPLAKAGPRGGVSRPSVLIGLIGSGIQASRTPAMHEAEGDRLGLRYVYKLIDLDKLGLTADALPQLLSAAQRMGFTGLNITHPCKQAIIPLLDDLSPDARAINAVNTVVFADGRSIGHNTDAWGFAESLRRGLPQVRRGRVVQLGAGGAGAAVAYAMLQDGVGRIDIVDTDRDRAATLAARLQAQFGADRAAAHESPSHVVAAADGLVNTTPVGMAKYPGVPLRAELLRRDLWVADIIYFPAETELLRRARALGCAAMSGEGMALFQAVAAFRHFTNLEPDPDHMRRHLQPADGAEQ